MKYSKLNKIKEEISLLGFGAMRMPSSQTEVNKMIKKAFELGINYFDTAHVYTGSEVALGKAFKQLDRREFFIADKLPFWGLDSIEQAEKLFQESLGRLETDYIDFYLMHDLNRKHFEKMIDLKILEWAIEKKNQGKIKYIGFSIHDTSEYLLKALEYYDWDFVQIQYNYMDLDGEPGESGYKELINRNIPIVIMEPLKGGLLSDLPENISKPYKDLGKTNVDIAFRWLAEKEGIMTVLSGMSNMEQLTENIEIFSNLEPLNTGEHSAIKHVEKNILEHQKVKCTGCRYCMPCPFGVKIAETFKAVNTEALNKGNGNWISGTVISYNSIKKCTNCGVCLEHCPQKINIPKELENILNNK